MTIIIGYDAHENSKAAVMYGASLARALGTPIRVVHVADIDDRAVRPDQSEREIDRGLSRRTHRDLVADLLGPDSDDWTFTVEHGEPAEVLRCEAARFGARIIVVGRPHHGIGAMVEHVVSGTVLKQLTSQQDCPVLIVPEGQASLVAGESR